MKQKVLPYCYSVLITDTPAGDRHNVADYDHIPQQLHLEILNYSTISFWMKYLGYKCYENKESYYKDGHERDDVVRDINDSSLI